MNARPSLLPELRATVETSPRSRLRASLALPVPFLKWAGGKGQLLDRILPELPKKMATYYEPFIGGGAVFFALAAERRFKRAVIADQNPAVVDVYRAVRDELPRVLDVL